MIEGIRTVLQAYLDLDPMLQTKLFNTVVLVVVLWLVRLLALRLVHNRFRQDVRALYNGRKIVDYTAVILGAFLIGRIWIIGLESVATYLGLVSAGLAIALQDLIVNLAGWAFIIWRRPLVVGDRIQIGEQMGDVIDIRLFEFSILEISNRLNAEQSTGRIIHIPNGRIFREALANFHQGLPYIWHEIPVTVTYESDWAKAKRILETVIHRYAPTMDPKVISRAKQVSRRFVISYRHLGPIVYTDVDGNGVRLTLRYLVPPRKRRDSEQVIWEAILKAFTPEYDIDFAYDTQREYIHYMEKKRPPAAETAAPPPEDDE